MKPQPNPMTQEENVKGSKRAEGVWPDGSSGPKTVCVCLKCGAVSGDPHGVGGWVDDCERRSRRHGPAQSVPVIPLSVAEGPVEALESIMANDKTEYDYPTKQRPTKRAMNPDGRLPESGRWATPRELAREALARYNTLTRGESDRA